MGRLGAAVRQASPHPGRSARRGWISGNRAHIEVRGLDRPGTEQAARQLEAALRRVAGVHWAEVNAVLGRVVVAFAAGEGGIDELIDVVSAFETANQLHRERLPTDRPDHPADVAPLHRQVVSLAADVVGIGVGAFAPRFAPGLRRRVVPTYVSGALSLVDSTPTLRRVIDAKLGAATTDLLLAAGNAVAQGVAEGPVGLLLDAAHRGSLLADITARRAVWARREPELHGTPHTRPNRPIERTGRPIPLPDGPIERYADRMSFVAAAAAASVAVGTRNHRLAQTILAAGNPKAARLGRESFAAWLGRSLAGHGVISLDASVLRRLDRLDTVVIDCTVLTTGRFRIADVLGVDRPPSAEDSHHLWVKAGALLDPDNPQRLHRRAGWTLGPLADVAPHLTRTLTRKVTSPGAAPLGLLHKGRLVAAVGVEAELDPLAERLVAAARTVGTLVIAGAGSGLGTRLGADEVIPRGSRLAGAVRDLQAHGSAVALVAHRNAAALSAADCGIGLLTPAGNPPWGAHLICGPGLAEAYRVLDAAVTARAVSGLAARVGLGGSMAAAVAAFAGPATAAARRARLAVNAATAAGMAVGAGSSWLLSRRADPMPAEPVPGRWVDPSPTG
jgi:cation-transporting ATPase I